MSNAELTVGRQRGLVSLCNVVEKLPVVGYIGCLSFVNELRCN